MNNKEIFKGLKSAPYDFIANNYYKMEKEQLKDILLETLAYLDNTTYEKLKNDFKMLLIEYKAWDEDE